MRVFKSKTFVSLNFERIILLISLPSTKHIYLFLCLYPYPVYKPEQLQTISVKSSLLLYVVSHYHLFSVILCRHFDDKRTVFAHTRDGPSPSSRSTSPRITTDCIFGLRRGGGLFSLRTYWILSK